MNIEHLALAIPLFPLLPYFQLHFTVEYAGNTHQTFMLVRWTHLLDDYFSYLKLIADFSVNLVQKAKKVVKKYLTPKSNQSPWKWITILCSWVTCTVTNLALFIFNGTNVDRCRVNSMTIKAQFRLSKSRGHKPIFGISFYPSI